MLVTIFRYVYLGCLRTLIVPLKGEAARAAYVRIDGRWKNYNTILINPDELKNVESIIRGIDEGALRYSREITNIQIITIRI